MRWRTLVVEPDTSDRSPQALEKLRLDCFAGMVRSLRLVPLIRWEGTKYTLTVRKYRGPFWTTLATVQNDLQPTDAACPLRWTTYHDGYSICALSHLYRTALCQAAGAYNLSFALPARLRDALQKVSAPHIILHGFRVLPVDFWEEAPNRTPVLTVLSAAPFTEQDWETVRFLWPILQVRFADLSEFPKVAEYFDQFHEYYLGNVRSVYGHIMSSAWVEELAETT